MAEQSRTERTFIIIKPDGVLAGLVDEVLRRVEACGYSIVAEQYVTATPELLAEHYADLRDKPFFGEIAEYMTSGPIVAVVAEGAGVIKGFRELAGATKPSEAEAGTIRADYGREYDDGRIENVVHGSDSAESAEREIALWFPNGLN